MKDNFLVVNRYKFIIFILLTFPFFGHAYFKGYLRSLGFENINVDLPTDELIFLSGRGFITLFSIFMETLKNTSPAVIFKIDSPAIFLFFSLLILFLMFGFLYNNKEKFSKNSNDSLKVKPPLSIFKLSLISIFMSLTAVIIGRLAAFVVILFVMTLGATSALVIYSGTFLGEWQGEKDWRDIQCAEVKPESVIRTGQASCTNITLKSSDENIDTGFIVYMDKSITLFRNNKRTYVFNSNDVASITTQYIPAQNQKAGRKE